MLAAAPDTTVRSLDELLRALRVDDLAGLSDVVGEENEADTWVEAEGDGIEVRCETVGTGLAFPFTLSDFWEVVRETEDDQVKRWDLRAT